MRVLKRPARQTVEEMHPASPGETPKQKSRREDVMYYLRAGYECSTYAPIGRRVRTVGDGIEPAVFSDGRGNGAWEEYCWYCGAPTEDMIQEHMLPSSVRGADDGSNLVSACRSCNALKRRLSVEEFREVLSERMSIEAMVFAGEAGLCVEHFAYRFGHLVFLDTPERQKILAASLAKKNDDPSPDERDPFGDNASKGLI